MADKKPFVAKHGLAIANSTNIVFGTNGSLHANNTITSGSITNDMLAPGAGGEVANAYLTSTFVSNSDFQSALANTNNSISDRLQVANATLLIDDRIQVANATLLINDRIQVANATLLINDRMQVANTLTLVNDRLQVANAVATYQTISVERAALANTNTAIADRMQVANVASAISTAISDLVDTAPATLDTLNELAAALGDDANFASTVTTNLGQKLGATATVALTGDVTATATAFSSNTVSLSTTVAASVTAPYLEVANASVYMEVSNTNTLVNDRLQVANAVATYQTISVERAALANTNTAIADRIQVANATLLINDRIQVANATLLINDRMQVANTNALVNDRLQVANAVATYQTISIERAALANTNTAIADRIQVANATLLINDRMQVANTNTLVNDRLQVANAVATYQTISVERAALANTNTAIADRIQVANATLLINDRLQVANATLLINDRLQVANAITTLAGLSDVAQVTPTDGHVLKYSSGNTTYYFAAESGGGAGGNSFSVIEVGGTLIDSAGSTARLSLDAGSNITLTPSAGNNTIVISSPGIASVSADSSVATANGTQTTFTSPYSTTDPKEVFVTVDGLLQRPTTDYTISGTTITFASAPLAGTTVMARVASVTTTIAPLIANSSVQVANGTQTTFTSPVSTGDPKEILVSVDGLLQRPTTDYTVSGTTVTFTSAPLTGTTVMVRFAAVSSPFANGSLYLEVANLNSTLSSYWPSANIIAYVSENAGGGANSGLTVATANGTQITFTSPVSSAEARELIVTVDGLVQTPNTDYTVNGANVTFDEAPYSDEVITIRTTTIQSSISLASLKAVVAASSDFNDFKSRIAAL